MFRNLLERLVGRPPDPTERWPRAEIVTPAIDLFRGAIGPVQFGAPLADAQALGRPDRCRATQPGYLELLWLEAGFQLDFDEGRLAYAAFFLRADAAAPEGVRPCRARLSTGLELSGETTLAEVEAALGAPLARDEDDEEWVLTYVRGGLTLELETSGRGEPKRLNVFPARPSGRS